jgi:non-specific protein-tyrosine kinase
MLDSAAAGHVEAYQKLRTSVDLANLRAGAKTILITSAVASEGKSTTAANLAVALARAGRRVALVDLDLRNPYIAALFQIEGQPGVTGVATGAVPIQEATVRTPVRPRTSVSREGLEADNGLDVLPSGITPADPAAFLTANVLGAIVHHLRDAYDIVIVDSPPALPVGDAMTLTRVVDAVIVVVRAGVARRPSLVELRRLLDAAPCERLGFVLTGADAAVNYTYGRRPYAVQDPARTRKVPTSARH